MFYIIADDLTGANDTGVQFSKKGYNAVVSILEESDLSIDRYTKNYEEYYYFTV